MIPLEGRRLAELLPAGRRLATRIEVLADCASTADELRRRLEIEGTAACAGLLLVAERQHGGRGRRERDWWSGPAGANLAFSLCLTPLPDPGEAAGLLAACALAAAVAPRTAAEVALKWPNDLLLDGAKAGGVLAEVPAARPAGVLLGVGLNVAAAPPAGVAPYPVTCVAARAVAALDRHDLLAAFVDGLERRWRDYREHGPAALEAEFLALLRRWAPHGVAAAGADPLPQGPLLQFSVRRGLTWGRDGRTATRPAGLLPVLRPLPAPEHPTESQA